MLKVIGIDPNITPEMIEAEVTLSITWSDFYSTGHVYWSAAYDQKASFDTLIEIGLFTSQEGDEYSFRKTLATIDTVTLLTIRPEFVTVQDEMCLPLALPEERGLPIFEWNYKNKWNLTDNYYRENMEFRLCISPEDVLIRFMPQTQIVRFITTDRVRFGVDADDHLTAIQVTQMRPDEIEAVKRLFVK